MTCAPILIATNRQRMQSTFADLVSRRPVRHTRIMSAVPLRTIVLAICALTFMATTTMGADWIWGSGDRSAAGATVEMEHTFSLDALPVADASLRVLGEYCTLEIEFNGKPLASNEAFDSVQIVPVKRWLRTGENHITVRATAIRGPSAVAVEIRSGGATLVETSATWKGVKSFGPVVALTLEVGMPKEISALDEYNQWTEAKKEHRDEAFSPLPDGYRLERLHRAPPEQGSWVSMAFDPKGGLVIAREKRGLLRLILADDKPPIVEVAEDSLLECRGLLFAHGVLYANANNSKALYKLRDTTDDGRFDEVTELMKTGGSVGHGRNDLALGPDGRLYSIHGDAVKLPSELHRTRSIGGAPGSEKGYLVSSDAQGGQRELVCVGLRNPYGIAFNHDGEPFTFDADNEGDIGLPLYRPTRVNHLVSGGNYGWWQVNGNQSWSVYAPDSLPTTVDIGRGSPTAVEFGYASHFPPRDREALFILDWAYGRILAVDLVPQGASYIGRARTFLRGRPLNVTDLAFGPEGAMYFITGGRGTRSALYRVRYEGDPHDDSQLTAQQLARAEFTAGARALRRQLEVYHGRTDPRAIDAAWLHLEDPDPWIRHAARTALEHQPVDRWAQRALKSGGPSALLALARVSGSKHREAIQRRAADIPFPKASRHQKLTLVRLCELTAGDAAPLAPHFPDEDPAVNRELSKLLVAQNNEAAVQSCLGLLAQADSQFETLHYLDVLSRAKVGLTLDDRRTFFRALEQRDYFRGDRNMPGYLKGLRQRATDTLSDNQRAALGDLLAPKPQDPPLPKPRPVVQHWTIEQLAQPPATPPGPNLHRGRKLFDQALCSRCHQVGGQGSAVGPNLTQVANRFSRRDLVEAIIEPSRAIAEVFQNLIVTKKDGTTVAGQLVRDDRRASTISLASSPFAPKQLTVVSKHDISSSARSPVSPMPPGLLDTLTREEIEHLLAFLQAGGAR